LVLEVLGGSKPLLRANTPLALATPHTETGERAQFSFPGKGNGAGFWDQRKLAKTSLAKATAAHQRWRVNPEGVMVSALVDDGGAGCWAVGYMAASGGSGGGVEEVGKVKEGCGLVLVPVDSPRVVKWDVVLDSERETGNVYPGEKI
jgi:hypothetical protein